MANFSTPRKAALPWFANLATLVVLLCTAWWSSDQRPLSPAGETQLAMPAASHHHQTITQPQAIPAVDATPLAKQPARPAQTTALPSDGIVSVGFNATALR